MALRHFCWGDLKHYAQHSHITHSKLNACPQLHSMLEFCCEGEEKKKKQKVTYEIKKLIFVLRMKK